MRVLGFIIVFSVFSFSSYSQLFDDFSDGDFLNNPSWGGDTSEFIVNSNFVLQLNSPAVTDTSYLSVETGTLDFSSNISWSFYVKMDFSPSNNNNFRYYLASNNNNLEGYLNGYFVRVGENGSLDKIKLYRQDGLGTTLLASSLHESFGINPEFRVLVNRDINGNWEVLCDSTGGNNFIYELGATDVTHTFSNFTGLWSKHTSSNNDNIFFDDISINGNILIDTLPPYIVNAVVKSSNSINIQFSEPLNNTVLDVNNYFLITNQISPTSIVNSVSGYELTFQDTFLGNQTLQLAIENVYDLSGNFILDTLEIIVPDTAQKGELLINEILFDPISGGSDYIEIINNSNNSFDIFNYFIADYENGPATLKKIDQHFIVSPHELVLFTEDSISTLTDYPTNDPSKFIQMDLPSFPNDSGTVFILNYDSIILDKFSYLEDYHFDLINDPEGVSLERVLLDSNINPSLAWHSAAENVGWGTPGKQNSQYVISSPSNASFISINEVFSPDNDGYQDLAIFSYNIREIGMVGNASVFDNRGRLIKKILSNELLPSQGQFTWDGVNLYGQKSSVGIYLIYFECFNTEGKILKFKSTITLKTRF